MTELLRIINGIYDSACVPHFLEFMELSNDLIRTGGNKVQVRQTSNIVAIVTLHCACCVT